MRYTKERSVAIAAVRVLKQYKIDKEECNGETDGAGPGQAPRQSMLGMTCPPRGGADSFTGIVPPANSELRINVTEVNQVTQPTSIRHASPG